MKYLLLLLMLPLAGCWNVTVQHEAPTAREDGTPLGPHETIICEVEFTYTNLFEADGTNVIAKLYPNCGDDINTSGVDGSNYSIRARTLLLDAFCGDLPLEEVMGQMWCSSEWTETIIAVEPEHTHE